jgi:hypothetical protein
MNKITITHELCTEDRARIDKLIDLLGTRTAQAQVDLEAKYDKQDEAKVNDFLAKTMNLAKETLAEDAPKTAQDEQKVPDHPTLDPFPEVPEVKAEASEASKDEKKTDVTMAMLTNKALLLSAADKKEQVRAIVHKYAPKVTALPEDKWAEVYEQLTALEG